MSWGTFCAVVSFTMVCRTLKASHPKLKNEKKYCSHMSASKQKISRAELSHLLNSVRLVTVYHADLEGLREPTDWAFLDVNDILNR